MGVRLKNAAGKEVEFQPGQVDYMCKHGWSRASKPAEKPKTDEPDAKSDAKADNATQTASKAKGK